jgi:16S rRNA (adenine1518-N6/adenine1519-N6)-dimethyltransferase
VKVVRADALQVDWNALMQESSPSTLRPESLKITGNIPYAITSPLIDKALEPPLPTLVVFLVQKEVADRLAAAPGNKTYGALTVGVQAAATVERLFAVRAGAFHPPPEVDSAVVRLRPRACPLIEPDETAGFRRFVTQLFSQRRKQIVRSLRSVAALEKGEAESAITAIGARPTDRVEVMSPETLVALFREVTSLTR